MLATLTCLSTKSFDPSRPVGPHDQSGSSRAVSCCLKTSAQVSRYAGTIYQRGTKWISSSSEGEIGVRM